MVKDVEETLNWRTALVAKAGGGYPTARPLISAWTTSGLPGRATTVCTLNIWPCTVNHFEETAGYASTSSGVRGRQNQSIFALPPTLIFYSFLTQNQS